MSDSSCLMHYFSMFGYQIINMLLLSLWISDETLFLVFSILLLGVWISDETSLLMFNILLLGVWMSDKTFLLVFDMLLLAICYLMRHSFLCLIYYFSVFVTR